MRDIKFEFLYKGLPYHSKTTECNWFKKVYTLDQLIGTPLQKLSDVHNQAELIAKRQFTGSSCAGGVYIYDGDIIQSYHFTDSQGKKHYLEHIIKWSDKFKGWLALSKESMNEEDGSVQLWVYMKSRIGSIKVIGNIHQNKEQSKCV